MVHIGEALRGSIPASVAVACPRCVGWFWLGRVLVVVCELRGPFYVCRLVGPFLGIKLRGPWCVLVCGAHRGVEQVCGALRGVCLVCGARGWVAVAGPAG